jgi:alkanesulfonate monooxygenase SsuD/methylene tetrahydromethanopterin reductase-like flavin-dependent oxidoreductase (luciferase family)
MDFGYHHTSFADEAAPFADAMLERARLVEAAGFSWFSLMDHLWQIPSLGRRDEPFLECYAGLSALAAVTDSMTLSGLVTCVDYRHPAYLAKLVASLDSLSDGRAMLAIGGGWYGAEYEAMGIPFADPATRIRRVRDAIRLCRTAWNDPSPVDYDGEYYSLDGFYLDPKPEEIPVLVGGAGEQLTLRLVADEADRWNVPGADPAEYEHKLDVLREHCETMDRDYDSIAKTVTLQTIVRDTDGAAHDAYENRLAETESGVSIPREEFRGLVGSPATVAERIERYSDLGVDALQIEPPNNDRETIERFVDDVMGEF